ncbi:hypothetical protein [Nesterenkonia pannonica]|uniref:hypothetical protein n=1 Tax=Nesterenkonia pannonica TaxID=1548602 RepID=UPI0021645C4B|nr:hypothetical protein [Nesterenkonia pannonica]
MLGCLLAGRLLHYLLAALWRESVAVSVTTACLLTIAASPLFAFIALTNFPLILAMTLFAMSVVGAMRMAMWNDTRAGFNSLAPHCCWPCSATRWPWSALPCWPCPCRSFPTRGVSRTASTERT